MSRYVPTAIVSTLLLLMSSSQADNPFDQGRVAIRGAIHQAACAIKTEDVEQTIAMGVLPLARLQRDGKGPGYPFSIQLVNCQEIRQEKGAIARIFSITFDNDSQPGQQSFAIHGEAKGVELMIIDAKGRTVMPGAAQAVDEHVTEQLDLRYHLFLVSNFQQLQAGSYAAAIRFHINYN